jgi:hypothetical protein
MRSTSSNIAQAAKYSGMLLWMKERARPDRRRGAPLRLVRVTGSLAKNRDQGLVPTPPTVYTPAVDSTAI